MKAVSFGLWGTDPKYTVGAIANAQLMPKVYPGWDMHVWFDRATVPPDVARQLEDMGVILHAKDAAIPAWLHQRFLIHDIPGISRYIIRDCDSRIGLRDRKCVDKWIEDKTILHTIHDHPYHLMGPPIMGGLWGFWKAGDTRKFEMRTLIVESGVARDGRWGSDQSFLDEEIWPRYKHSVTQHGKVLPIEADPEDPNGFCGEVIGPEGQVNEQHRQMKRQGHV